MPAYSRGCIQGLAEPPNLLEIIQRFEVSLRIHILSTESEILLALYDRSPLSVAELQARCSASPAKFFATLSELHGRGLADKVVDPADARRRLYTLADEVRTYVCELLRTCLAAAAGGDLAEDARLLVALEQVQMNIANHYGIALTSYRYRIMSSLFRLERWHPGDGHKLADTSQVSFFAALDHLKSIGVIECVEDPADRRKKYCRLTATARHSFSEVVREIFTYLQDFSESHSFAIAPLALLLM